MGLNNRKISSYAMDVSYTAENVGRAIRDLRGEAPMAGEVLEPKVGTAEAEEVAAKARRAVSRSVALTSWDRRWELSPADTVPIAPVGP